MSTLTQLRSRVTAILQDTGYGITSQTTVDQAINDAQRRLSEITKLFHTTSTTSSVSGTQEYDLPSDYIAMYADDNNVRYTDSSSVVHYPKYVDFNVLYNNFTDLLTATGTPTYFYLKEKKIGFYPTPNYSGSSNVVFRYFNHAATLSSGSTESDFRERWTRAIVLLALAYVHEINERSEKRDEWMYLFELEISKASNLGDTIETDKNSGGFSYFGA